MKNELTSVHVPAADTSRRRFIGAIWGAGLLALVGQFGTTLFSYLKPRLTPGGFGDKVTVGKPQEFKKGTVSYVLDGHCYISRLPDGGFLALWQRCTHLGCTVPWRKDQHQFNCPCHSSLFNPQGEVIGGPAPRPLDLFPIELVAGQLVVDTGKPIVREKFEPSQAFYA